MNYFLDLVYNLVMSPRMALRTITGGRTVDQCGNHLAVYSVSPFLILID